MTSTGELYLRINLSSDLAATGSYAVTMKLSRKPEQAENEAATQSSGIASAISPAIFAAIPRRVQDQQGNLGDMVNFALIGSQEQVEQAFQNAGWVVKWTAAI